MTQYDSVLVFLMNLELFKIPILLVKFKGGYEGHIVNIIIKQFKSYLLQLLDHSR